ncbi:MAG: helix-turn-helix domain-containing protein [Methanocellales archaeon]|nr:helix-turn-helix domain-containing protein [Methanocellales archaeon]MDD3292001.1 helix-turn-helix domain-containing protein [Methanocellales archaeon]MDD5235716.1 helix-turn-helix domain-containing protein [Methanocellales archaeon]MDD5485642.1 helix-turn-helix domain-containing protein [Methanocellales archaeon]
MIAMDSAKLLDILGNENRRKILQLLSQRPHYISEIVNQLNVGPKAVLGHLEMLERAGLIECLNEQRRKYFYITGNVQLDVSLSPYLYGMEVSPIRIDAEEQRRVRQEYSSMNALLNQELQRLHALRRELMLAQRSAQSRIIEIMNLCSEMIDNIASDPIEAEILLTLVGGARTAEKLSKELNLPADQIERSLNKLKEKRAIIEKEREWYIR